MYNEFCKELSGTYDLIEMNDECHFLTIQKLTHGSHNFTSGQCLTCRAMRLSWAQSNGTNIMKKIGEVEFVIIGPMERVEI
jgi:hypothetical protein